MNPSPTRRQTLLALGAFAALPTLRGVRLHRASPAAPRSLDGLVPLLREAPRPRALELAGRALREGAGVTELLGAVLEIGARDVRPRPHGILHTVMMVHSSFALAEGASEHEARLLALWNLDDLKGAQERDRVEDGDWTLPPPAQVRPRSVAAAHEAYHAAMEDTDPERADRALVALLPHVDRAAFFEATWAHAARCGTFLGHKAIHAANLERALRRLPWERAAPALRSLVRTLLVERDTAAWEAVAEPAERLGGARGVEDGEPRVDAALELYHALRDASPEQALATAVEALEFGVRDDELWCALRLGASEVFHRRPGRRSRDGRDALLSVHGSTVVEALGHMARTTEDAGLARRLLLLAARRLPELRDWLVGSTGLLPAEGSIDRIGAESEPEDLEHALASGSTARVAAHLRAHPAGEGAYVARLRSSLLRTAREHHQTKYLAATIEERRTTPAALRPALLSPAAEYVAHPRDEVTDLHRRSLAALG